MGHNKCGIVLFEEPGYFTGEDLAGYYATGNKEYLGTPPTNGWRLITICTALEAGGTKPTRWHKDSLAGNVGVVSGIFPPKTTDMPTCRRCVPDTTQTMSATLHRVGSSDAVSVSCRHDDLPKSLHMSAKNY